MTRTVSPPPSRTMTSEPSRVGAAEEILPGGAFSLRHDAGLGVAQVVRPTQPRTVVRANGGFERRAGLVAGYYFYFVPSSVSK